MASVGDDDRLWRLQSEPCDPLAGLYLYNKENITDAP